MVKRVGKYEIGKTLGEGTFGKVKYAVNTESGQRVAIKILDKEKIQKQNMGGQIKKEISIMKMVKHKHVVKLYEVLASRTKIFIVLELITGGELFDKIVAEGRFREATARFYFRQLIDGVRYCHQQGVAHRDLKPENLLLDEQSNLKISDFGLSALYTGAGDDSRTTLLHTTCGTPNYVAPEVLNDKGYDGRAADVWSCGVILYVLLAGFLPFDEPHMSALFRKIQKAEFNYPSWFSSPVRNLIDRILVADPTKRVTVADIMADPWYRGDTDSESGSVVSASTEGSVPLVAAPSAKDVENAVQEGVAVEEKKSEEESTTLNAFDVCNMMGGIALNRMLLTSVHGDKRNQSPQFLTELPTADVLRRAVIELERMGAEASVDEKGSKVKARIVTSHGEISLSVLALTMSPELRLVEVRRGRGDLLEYNKLFQRLRESMNDVMTRTMSLRGRAAAGGGGGSA